MRFCEWNSNYCRLILKAVPCLVLYPVSFCYVFCFLCYSALQYQEHRKPGLRFILFYRGDRNSVVSIVTGLWNEQRGSVVRFAIGIGDCSSVKRQARFWGPCNLFFSGSRRIFPSRVKKPVREVDPSTYIPPCLAQGHVHFLCLYFFRPLYITLRVGFLETDRKENFETENLYYSTHICGISSVWPVGLQDRRAYNTLKLFLILTLRRLMSYIYGAPILDVSRSHTTTQHSR